MSDLPSSTAGQQQGPEQQQEEIRPTSSDSHEGEQGSTDVLPQPSLVNETGTAEATDEKQGEDEDSKVPATPDDESDNDNSENETKTEPK